MLRILPKLLEDSGGSTHQPKGTTDVNGLSPLTHVLDDGPMITTTHEPIVEDVCERRKTRRQGQVHYEQVTVQRPTVIGHYNRHMGGVDLFDQLVQYLPLRPENS